MMFKVLIIAALAAIGSADMTKLLEDQKEHIPACEKDSGFKVPEMKDGEKPDMEVWKSHDANCFTKCISLKSGAFDDKGEPNVDKIKSIVKHADDAKLKEATDKCKEEITDTDMCDKVGKTAACIYKATFH